MKKVKISVLRNFSVSVVCERPPPVDFRIRIEKSTHASHGRIHGTAMQEPARRWRFGSNCASVGIWWFFIENKGKIQRIIRQQKDGSDQEFA
jgi:hypothetical protein